MGVNKVVFGDVPIIDISDSAVTPNTLCAGGVAYGADGEKVVGVNPYEKEATDAEVSEQENLIQQIKTALEGKAAGGGSGSGGSAGATINVVQVKPSRNSTSISFTGLMGEPKMFAIMPMGNLTLGTTRYVTGVISDGSITAGTYGYRSGSSATSYYSDSYFTWTYNNGTLTVNTSSSTNGGNFSSSATYVLIYAV